MDLKKKTTLETHGKEQNDRDACMCACMDIPTYDWLLGASPMQTDSSANLT